MKPQRYTGIPIGGGERVEGYYTEIPRPLIHVGSVDDWDFVKVDPATVEPVRLPVKHERTPVGSYRCPACNVAFIDDMGKTAFCGACGQALRWPEDKEAI